MKIKFLSGIKSGTTEHINNETGNLLIAAGLAEHIPYKDFRERLREEGQGMQQPDSQKSYPTPQWSLVTLRADGSPKYIIEKLHNFERTLYGKPNPQTTDAAFIQQMHAAGCPAGIVQQYLNVLPGAENKEAIVEKMIQQRYRDQSAQKEQSARENGLASVILGVGK